jgi:hypothetical protein
LPDTIDTETHNIYLKVFFRSKLERERNRERLQREGGLLVNGIEGGKGSLYKYPREDVKSTCGFCKQLKVLLMTMRLKLNNYQGAEGKNGSGGKSELGRSA